MVIGDGSAGKEKKKQSVLRSLCSLCSEEKRILLILKMVMVTVAMVLCYFMGLFQYNDESQEPESSLESEWEMEKGRQ